MKNIFTYIPCELVNLAKSCYRVGLRDYHDWDHITNLVGLAVKHNITLTQEQELAIMFHDAIYIPGSTYSEVASFDVMKAYIGEFNPEISWQTVLDAGRMILDTAEHYPSIEGSAVVSDLDLLVLSDAVEFAASHEKVYNEACKLVPDYDKFIALRKQWASRMLGKQIYHSKYFKDKEPEAKQNLIEFINS